MNKSVVTDPIATLDMLEDLGIPAFICQMDTIIKTVNPTLTTILEIDKDILEGFALFAIGGFGAVADAITRQYTWDKPFDCTTGKTHWQAQIREIDNEQCLIFLQDVTTYRERENFQRDAMNMVAHDLKTPISVIKSYADLIKQVGEMNPQQTQFAERIKTAVVHMSGLVSDLVDLTWIDTNSPLSREETRIEFIVKNSLDNVQMRAKNDEVTLEFEYEENIPLILADPDRLRRVFVNLLSNAIKFSIAGGTVTASVKNCPDDHHICVTIADTGPGIPPEHLPHIFDRFYQAPRSDGEKRIRGSGLGLAIVKGLVEKHSGTIKAESTLGEGSQFHVYLPTGHVR